MRKLASALFLLTAATLSWAVAVGRIDLLAIAPIPPLEQNEPRSAVLGARSLEGFEIERLALQDGRPVWRASGAALERAGEGFAAREPRLQVFEGRAETRVAAPRATFGSPLGTGPVSGELAGGVSLVSTAVAIETERLSIELAAGVASETSGRRLPTFATRTPVRATFARATPGAPPVLTGVVAEGGVEARGDLHRLELRGPVTIRDEEGELLLDAEREATVVLARSPSRLFSGFESAASGLAFEGPFVRELRGGWVIALLEARGHVRLEARSKHGQVIEARGEWLQARPLAGALRVEGEGASLREASSGASVRAPRIVARDLGAEGISVLAHGGVVLGARVRSKRDGSVHDWEVTGDEARARLVASRPGEASSLEVAEASVTTSAARPGRCRSVDGRFTGRFERFELADSPGGLAARIEGSPAALDSVETHLRARSIDYLGETTGTDRVRLEGDALVALGPDVNEIAPIGSNGPLRASGDRIALDADDETAQLSAESDRGSAVAVVGSLHVSARRWRLDALKKAPSRAKRPLAAPDALVAFHAEEAVELEGPDGVVLAADRLDLQDHALVATSEKGRVHAKAPDTEVFARRLEARDAGEDARRIELVGDVSIAHVQSGTKVTLEADRVRGLAFVRAPLGKPEVVWGPLVAWQEGPGLLSVRSSGKDGVYSAKGRVLRAYPASGLATIVGSVAGELRGESGVPLSFTAPRAEIQVRRAASRPKTSRGAAASERVFAALRDIERFSSTGGVHARYKDQTYDADSLSYDGHAAVLEGQPLRVHDGVANMDFQTRRMTVDLDASGPPR